MQQRQTDQTERKERQHPYCHPKARNVHRRAFKKTYKMSPKGGVEGNHHVGGDNQIKPCGRESRLPSLRFVT